MPGVGHAQRQVFRCHRRQQGGGVVEHGQARPVVPAQFRAGPGQTFGGVHARGARHILRDAVGGHPDDLATRVLPGERVPQVGQRNAARQGQPGPARTGQPPGEGDQTVPIPGQGPR